MHTVFSHIIQKRFSQVNEDVATDALAYVLESSEDARRGMLKLLRGIAPDLPPVHFETQQTEGTIRPDMWGLADTDARVFVENKFWAGLTDNQPISYLNQLALFPQPTILLVVAPAAREHTLWRELTRRLEIAGLPITDVDAAAGVARVGRTPMGPMIALTSWTSLLSALEHEAVDDPRARGDLVQLRALTDAADIDAFTPVSAMELSDQRTPAFILRLGSVVQGAVDLGVAEGTFNVAGLRPQASWDRIGRYVRISGEHGVGAWIGVHLGLWKAHGVTPLWLLFIEGDFSRGQEVRRYLEPWAVTSGILSVRYGRDFAVALEIPVGEEKSTVERRLVDISKTIGDVLSQLPSKSLQAPGPEGYVD